MPRRSCENRSRSRQNVSDKLEAEIDYQSINLGHCLASRMTKNFSPCPSLSNAARSCGSESLLLVDSKSESSESSKVAKDFCTELPSPVSTKSLIVRGYGFQSAFSCKLT